MPDTPPAIGSTMYRAQVRVATSSTLNQMYYDLLNEDTTYTDYAYIANPLHTDEDIVHHFSLTSQ